MPVSPPATASPTSALAALRRDMARLERAVPVAAHGVLPFGIEALDERLGGGLACGALHAVHEATLGQAAAASGLAVAVLSLAARRGHVLWVHAPLSRWEDGALHGPGLALFGLSPDRLTLVEAARAPDLLWCAEEALASGALAAVLVEMRGSLPAFDLTASRRLALAAARGGALGLVLRTGVSPQPMAGATRFLVAPAASRAGPAIAIGGLGPPRFTLTLDRNRAGAGGCWTVEWTMGAAHVPRLAAVADDAGAILRRRSSLLPPTVPVPVDRVAASRREPAPVAA